MLICTTACADLLCAALPICCVLLCLFHVVSLLSDLLSVSVIIWITKWSEALLQESGFVVLLHYWSGIVLGLGVDFAGVFYAELDKNALLKS